MASSVAPGCPVHADFDPLSARYVKDPFAVLAELPAGEGPVFYAPAIDYYVVTRHEDIEAVFLDHDTFSAGAAQLPLATLSEDAGKVLLGGGHRPAPSMVSLDPPEHTRVRRHTARAFTPRRVAEMTGTIRATVAQLLDEVDASAPFDLAATLTFPLPATIVFSLIGVPREDYGRLKRWCGYRAGLTFGRPAPEEQVEHAENIVAYRGYLRALVADRVQRRADDLTSAELPPEHLVPRAAGVVGGGWLVARPGCVGGGARRLLHHRGEAARGGASVGGRPPWGVSYAGLS
ncbi:MAG TPA: hypothetical protein VFY32_00650 [Solirubrobacteraceae bacterium]|nr:hypothetical protein [Solirubrobacteraceae bacterium]